MCDVPRMPRFDVHLEAWYRVAGDTNWRHGTTRNVSTSGALIEGEAPAFGDRLVVVISLPSAGCLIGRGRIVRTAYSGPEPPTFAAAIERYAIQHRATSLASAARLLQECYAV